jgi:hypothetical protein
MSVIEIRRVDRSQTSHHVRLLTAFGATFSFDGVGSVDSFVKGSHQLRPLRVAFELKKVNLCFFLWKYEVICEKA